MNSTSPKITHGGYPSAATGPLNPNYPNGVTIGGGGVGVSSNNVFISGGNVGAGSINSTYTISSQGIGLSKSVIPTSPNLPDITLTGHDEGGKKVMMTLVPERSISGFESLQLAMLLSSYRESPNHFCPLAFVKKNHLERHFKFS